MRWTGGVTKMDRIRNERIRGTTKVGEISKKVQERRLMWYGHVMRRYQEHVGKRVMRIDVQGRRRKGRPKQRWIDSVNVDWRERRMSGEETQNRAVWRQLVRNIDPQIEVGKMWWKKSRI